MRLRGPGGSTLRVAYCSNVLPVASLADLRAAIAGTWADVARRVGPAGRLGVGLWLPSPLAAELVSEPLTLRSLAGQLERAGLEVLTMNAFPAEAFHAPVVKEAVYRPDWTESGRITYTLDAAVVAASLSRPGVSVPVSTLPLGYPKLDLTVRTQAAAALAEMSRTLDRLHAATGVFVQVALEPEPGCALERTEETIAFFHDDLYPAADRGRTPQAARRHIGVCLDLCHAAVAHEDPVAALESYRAAGIPVPKVQVSAALEVPEPADPGQRALLQPFVEPRWLHQVGAPGRDIVIDLPQALADPGLAEAAPWRVHFHVPLHRAEIGGLPTTSATVADFLRHVATLEDPPLLELETYTWSVMPGASDDLAANVAAEVRWVADVLAEAGCREMVG